MDENLYDLQFALNASKNSSTGFTLAFFNFGRGLEPIQTLNKDLVDIKGVELQNVIKWVERQKLKI